MNFGGNACHVAIIGAGFCGLAAAYELTKRGVQVTIFEKKSEIGGLSGSFSIDGVRLEKFYHHWFRSDEDILALTQELGTFDKVVFRPTRTGIYYANRFFRLSSPVDLLRFYPLPMVDRLRLGFLTLYARHIKEWRNLEHITAKQWVQSMSGVQVFDTVWNPLLRGKFGEYSDEISAVWLWNKLKLRGTSRAGAGQEQLAYYRGSFSTLIDELATHIISAGGRILSRTPIWGFSVKNGRVVGVKTPDGEVPVSAVIATPAFPIIANLLEPHVPSDYVAKLRRIRYLANVCMILELDRKLSDLYWINVSDTDFPFVGIIEHTNFEPPSTYGGRHIIYLSKYLPETSDMIRMTNSDILKLTVPHLQRMFPTFNMNSIKKYHVFRARYSQPVVECGYSNILARQETPIPNVLLATMAQIYPEDRGTNYAVKAGRLLASKLIDKLH